MIRDTLPSARLVLVMPFDVNIKKARNLRRV